MSQDLWSICTDTYFPRRLKIRSQQTRKNYHGAIRAFDSYLGRPATVDDLNDDTVTLWLSDMLTRGESQGSIRSVETSASKASCVITLWRFLAFRRVVEQFPTVELPDSPEPSPIALDEQQLRRLFESAMCRPGFVAGVPARYWWPALFGFVFSTSERKGGTFAARWDWVNLDTRMCVIPAAVRKGKKKTATYPLWDEVVWLLGRITEPLREVVFAWDKSECSFYKHYSKILIDAAIPNTRKHKLQGLRVTHNTWVKVFSGKHSPLLMHSSSATSERHYEDKRFTAAPPTKLFIPWQASS